MEIATDARKFMGSAISSVIILEYFVVLLDFKV